MNDKEKLEAFLKELAELTNKYGLSIGGCGCCGSPWIEDINTREYIDYGLTYRKNTGMYETDEVKGEGK